MSDLQAYTEKILAGQTINRAEAAILYAMPLAPLAQAADKIRAHFCGDTFDLCTIVNAKGGNCSEDCRFCAQSAFSSTEIKAHPLLSVSALIADAVRQKTQGVQRYSLVTAGRTLSEKELDHICLAVNEIVEQVGISVCGSFGLLDEAQCRRLAESGISRIHNNLETSPTYFPKVCSTHTTEDKIRTIQAAQKAGLTICSGGILGLGEKAEDRIDLALVLRDLGIKHVPINVLKPIAGTPLAHVVPLKETDVRRIVAVYRFILPDATLRLAGGRGLLEDQGRGCFTAGANAAITGDMLTTAGNSVATDLKLLDELGYSSGALS